MHYYKKNIGDYYKKAGRLSMLEHGAYTVLIDSCYDRERFPTLDDAIDWTWARTDEEINAVKFVLSKFFTLDGDVYIQNRIQDEISEYKSKAETNKRIATERESKRKLSKQSVNEPFTSREDNQDILHEPPPNHKPITINQEPLTIIKDTGEQDKPVRFMFNRELVNLGCDKKLVDAFMAVRKTKKATNSEKAFELFIGKCKQSNLTMNQILEICIDKDWKNFDATWLKSQNNSRGTDNFHDSFYGVGQSPFGKQEQGGLRDVGSQVLIGNDDVRF